MSDSVRPIILIPGVNGTQLYDSSVLLRPPAWDVQWPASPEYHRLKLDMDGRYEANPCVWIRTGRPPPGQYHALQTTLKAEVGAPVFVMTYDWRKSCVEAAAELERLVAEVRARTGAVELDFVGYSLGGVVFRAWLKRQAEPERAFHRAVLMGAPLRGTLMCIELMVADTHPLFGFARRIWRTLRSFPCVYEMLPTYPGAVLAADGSDASATVFQAEAWPTALTQLPPEADPIRAGFLQAAGEVVEQKLFDLSSLDAEARGRMLIVGGSGAITSRSARRLPELSAETWSRSVEVGTGDGDGVVLTDESLRVSGIRDWTYHLSIEGINLLWQRFVSPRWLTAPLLHMALPMVPAVVGRVAQFLKTGD